MHELLVTKQHCSKVQNVEQSSTASLYTETVVYFHLLRIYVNGQVPLDFLQDGIFPLNREIISAL